MPNGQKMSGFSLLGGWGGKFACLPHLEKFPDHANFHFNGCLTLTEYYF